MLHRATAAVLDFGGFALPERRLSKSAGLERHGGDGTRGAASQPRRDHDEVHVAALYDALLAQIDSPVVAINRAIAIAELHGAAAGLAVLDGLARDRRLTEYQPYWAARAALLARTGNGVAAADAYQRAIGLEIDPAVRNFLQECRAQAESQNGDRP